MTIDTINQNLKGSGILVSELIDNNKASEKYVRTTFKQSDGFEWKTVVPYYIRRSGLFIETEEELADYLKQIKPYFAEKSMYEWEKKERKKWVESKADITKQFFFRLLSFKEEIDFPANDNPARRIQDIKDAGYTLASIANSDGRKTSRILLPIPLTAQIGYEIFTPQFKNRVIRLLKGINAYEAKPTAIKALIPDHKFSEVRWDAETKKENSMEMTDEEIIQKFQLLDNQRNQQKREVCRKCFQDNIRGQIFGIDYFGKGKTNWDEKMPKVGKAAEKGCEGCPWYDIEAWRKSLNQTIKKK